MAYHRGLPLRSSTDSFQYIYTNDQPIPLSTDSFIYTDNWHITAQKDTFTEQTLPDALCHLQELHI